jgi:Anti-sigma-K factor rskA, C-terminal
VWRRRIAGAAAAATLLLFILLVWPVGLLTGDDGDDGGGGDNGGDQADEQPKVLGQLLLRPQSGEKGAVGIALITERDGERSLLVQARGLRPTRQGQAYEVWLYNGQRDAVSMGAQLTDRQGNYQGAGRLPENYEKYRALDISRENVDQNAAHSGDSVLRGQFKDLQAAGTGSGELEEPQDTEQGSGSPLP